jgi:hypothetical protein
VSNTGPLIALISLNQLELLHRLFGSVFIPLAVRAEVQDELSLRLLATADWIQARPAQDILAIQLLHDRLGAGESEAIILAKEIGASWTLLDDLAARRTAQAVGLQVVGTLGVLLMAKVAGHIPAIKPLLDLLRQTNFHMSADLYEHMLEQAGEAT